MYAVTEPHAETLPVEPYAGNEVSCAFLLTSPTTWVGTTKCKHGQVQNSTHLIAPGTPPLDPTQMVFSAYRQHELIVGGDCPTAEPMLSATVTYAAATGILPGERRVVIEQSAVIPPAARKNFLYFGRLTCTATGSFYIDAIIKLSRSVASGAVGFGYMFAAGVPSLLSAPMVDVDGVATAILRGILNLYPNQPLAFAYTNTGTANQDVQAATLKVSEVWIP